jgi:glycosyltransferase involved in cell wall biosynthesis
MKVSVIIPTFNSEKFIKRAIYSVLIQSYKDFELIIVDDCSTDNTVKIIESFNDDRIKIVKHDVNTGVGVARQTGLKYTTGDFVLFVDSDDYLKDDFIEMCVLLQKQENADIIYTSFSISFPNAFQTMCAGDYLMEKEATLQLYYTNQIKFLTGKLIRRSLCDKIVWSNNRIGEDCQTLYMLMYEADLVRSSSYTGYIHVWREGSLLANKPQMYVLIGSLYAEIDVINFLIEKNNKRLLDYQLNNWLVQYRQMKVTEGDIPVEMIDWYNKVIEFRKNNIFDDV